jgi:LysM repeat protein
MRSRRSPARWLAPIALVACAVVVYSVVNKGVFSDEPASTSPAAKSSTSTSRTGSERSTAGKRRAAKRRRTYVVKAGDTLSAIAVKTGVSLQRIQELNPELDSQSLQTGQLVKLSP